jgi:hypothetical protein
VKHAYHNLVYFNEAEKGGHFAAWEEPEIFASEMRAAFKSLRLLACERRARKVRAARGLFAERLALSRHPLLADDLHRQPFAWASVLTPETISRIPFE